MSNNRKISPILFVAAAIIGLFIAVPVFAQGIDLKEFAEAAGFATGPSIQVIIARLIRTFLTFIGIVVVVMILYAGFLYITAGGNTKRLETAKKILSQAIVGLIITLSAYGIVQFVLSKLVESGAGGIEVGGPGGAGAYPDSGALTAFKLNSVNTECASGLRNIQLQLVFSKNVLASTVSDAIAVKQKGGDAVSGTLATKGKVITFTPSASCPDPNATAHCFAANTEYELTVNSSVLKSISGASLQCTVESPCDFSFTTGEGVDVKSPTISMKAPENGKSVIVGLIEVLQADTKDDTGVSSVDFYAINDDEALYTSGLNFSSEKKLTGADLPNFFSTDPALEWDTAGYATNQSYSLWASASDCAGNSATAAKISAVVRALNCDNKTLDEEFGETSVDCGGDSTSEFYCGKCATDSCGQTSECAPGLTCVNEECVSKPQINEISPGDGAVQNLVTIKGQGFGTTGGTVTFIGAQGKESKTVSAYSCNGEIKWSDKQIIVQVPSGATDGPIEVTTAGPDVQKDKTNDDFGPFISNFDVNAIKRPGLCDADPDSSKPNTETTFSGFGFGTAQGSSVIYFKNYLSPAYNLWSDAQVKTVVPNISSGSVDTQAFTGDYRCIDATGKETGTLCTTDNDCGEGNTCAQSWCSETLSYCSSDLDCKENNEGLCVSVRVGSNKLAFTILATGEAATVPNISYISPNSGPIGQYITIFGTNFGNKIGQVYFANELGKKAVGDTQFPEQCSKQFWSDTSIIVKVPEEFQVADELGDEIVPGTYQLSLTRQDGQASNSLDFVVVEGNPGPAICQLDPVAGPAKTPVTIYGENFGVDDGTITFYDLQQSDYLIWENTQITDALVPAEAKSGPVSAKSSAGFTSNSVNFLVGNCNEGLSCPVNTFCCGDGSCKADQTACELGPKESHFAYRISTGLIPVAPKVKVACDGNTISPSPWENWADSKSVCLNAVVRAEFTKQMDQDSIYDNVIVEKCSDQNSDLSCKEWQTIDGDIKPSEIGFKWTPKAKLSALALHRVTVKGGQGGVRAHDDVGGAFMEEDYSWEFVTGGADELCEVGDVNVSPAEFTATKDDQEVVYESQLIAAKHQCLTISCEKQDLSWSSNFPGAVVMSPTSGNALCQATIQAIDETSGNPAKIKAEVTNAKGNPQDTGDLTIDFSDPKVEAFSPNCSTACVNAIPWAKFNTKMNESTLVNSATIYKCEDSLCAAGEITKVNVLAGIDYNENEKTMFLNFTAGSVLSANSWYRVVLAGAIIKSTSNVALKESGANYGEDFSWIFKTKDSDISCGIDSIGVSPDVKTLKYVGQRQEYNATTYGSPDDCDASGQALQNTNYTWKSWSAKDTPDNFKTAQGGSDKDVAFMLQNGAIKLADILPEWCTIACLNAGATLKHTQAICGDGIVDYNGDGKNEAEECDDGNTNSGDGCSANCLKEGSSLSCGNSKIDAGEQCDDGNTVGADGCSALCLNNGSSSVGSNCGDGIVDFAPQKGGEDCDDGNKKNGDGCSSQCLFEGSVEEENVYAVCGNNKIESGEDCDDGNAVSGDGCNEKCLNEGTTQCAFVCSDTGQTCSVDADCPSASAKCNPFTTPCCGNGNNPEKGEDCDDDNLENGDGCSEQCLKEGASSQYTTPSFCGDAQKQTGEECEVQAGQLLKIGGYGVGEIDANAPKEVNAQTGYAISTITAEAEGVTGDATLQIECSCKTDQSCGDVKKVGCGEGSCCFLRPKPKYPFQPPSGNGPDGKGYCRNTAVSVKFDQKMDVESFVAPAGSQLPNLRLQLLSKNDVNVYTDPSICPSNYQLVSSDDTPSGWFVKIWNFVKTGFWSLFGKDVSAAIKVCSTPLQYEMIDEADGQKVVLVYPELLEPNSRYQIKISADTNTTDGVSQGVTNENGVGICFGKKCQVSATTHSFKIGSEVCLLEAVDVEDDNTLNLKDYEIHSPQFFSKKDETHEFVAQAMTYRDGLSIYEPINPTKSYAWTWDWGSSIPHFKPGTTPPVVNPDDIIDESTNPLSSIEKANFSSLGINGIEHVTATATISKDTLNTPTTTGKPTAGTLEITALMCENPWPALNSPLGFPYLEKTDPTKPSNFGFYYCRDRGIEGTPDDLPSLADPVDVTSVATAGLLQELFFKVQGTSDAIGVRVFQNPNYLSPKAWFESQDFIGTYKEIEIDGYQAIQSGNTAYVAAANEHGTIIYPNIYVVSYNPNAGADAKEIFEQIFGNWKFNANTDVISNVGLCKTSGAYVQNSKGDFINCSWDGDCLEILENGECTISKDKQTVAMDCPLDSTKNAFCDNDKSKLQNDMQRLTDITTTISALNKYGSQNKHCSVTKNQGCSSDPQCPGNEVCVEGYPTVQQGTYVPAMSVSKWESWNAILANAVGTKLPNDPIDAFWQGCKQQGEGFDPLTCFNGLAGMFVCPEGSHVYGYQNKGGEKYTLFTQMEYKDAVWSFAIDQFPDDDATIIAEYSGNVNLAGQLAGFFPTVPAGSSQFCKANVWGTSAVCGDGVVGQNETCEPGQVKAEYLADGYVNVSCKDDCSNYQTAAEAIAAGSKKIDFACGNGVLEGSEKCDDGAQNGTYGHCDSGCTFTNAFLCGDGYLAGGEQCDCGSIDNFASLMNNAQSWAKINQCEASNGQYGADPNKTCTYDCKQPGLSCGDKEVNGPEECDGGSETWSGKLCTDNKTICETSSDCPTGTNCGTIIAGFACGKGRVCEDGVALNSNGTLVNPNGHEAGHKCVQNLDCKSNQCPNFLYELSRTRVCKNDCSWPGWPACSGGDQWCGNGKAEGTEECDDGNDSNNDSCTTGCKKNICGDSYVYSGVEACDSGSENVGPFDSNPCEVSYDDTCNYCNWQCQYKTLSGSYCGDGIINGDEFCDGDDQQYWCFDYNNGDPQKGASCAKSEALEKGSVGSCETGYVCHYTGVCNGGANNGKPCTIQPPNKTSTEYTASTNKFDCGTDSICVAPTCASDCQTSCPFVYKKTGILVQSELEGAQPLPSVYLYSYQNKEQQSPDTAVLYLPACSVGTKITTNIDNSQVVEPNIDIVFVTDLTGSMINLPSGGTGVAPNRRVDIVTEAAMQAIDDLSDAYTGTDGTIMIGLVSYGYQPFGTSPPAHNVQDDVANLHPQLGKSLLSLNDSGEKQILKDIISTYPDNFGGWTLTGSAIKKAIQILKAQPSDHLKIVILLADGEANHTLEATTSNAEDSNLHCSKKDTMYLTTEAGNTMFSKGDYCIAQARYKNDMILDHKKSGDIMFYSGVISSNNKDIAHMEHLSSLDCKGNNMADKSDCTNGQYAYQATTAQGIKNMYAKIVESILESKTTITATKGVQSSSETSITPVGQNIELPLPETFACQNKPTLLPIQTIFNGTGRMRFDNITFEYCPTQ